MYSKDLYAPILNTASSCGEWACQGWVSGAVTHSLAYPSPAGYGLYPQTESPSGIIWFYRLQLFFEIPLLLSLLQPPCRASLHSTSTGPRTATDVPLPDDDDLGFEIVFQQARPCSYLHFAHTNKAPFSRPAALPCRDPLLMWYVSLPRTTSQPTACLQDMFATLNGTVAAQSARFTHPLTVHLHATSR